MNLLSFKRKLPIKKAKIVGSLKNCISNGTDMITKSEHGLDVIAGNLIHIRNATTRKDKGYYRIISSTPDAFVVDRELSGFDDDIELIVYKDPFVWFSTNGSHKSNLDLRIN